MLDLSPSTYDYYEVDRVPPADVLVKIADATGVDLRWLITGQASTSGQPSADHPVLARARRIIERDPRSAEAVGAFLELLSASLKLPDSAEDVSDPVEGASTAAGHPSASRQADSRSTRETAATGGTPAPGDPAGGYIPVLGRSAAGIAHFWGDANEAGDVTTLGQLVARRSAQAARTQPARLTWEDDESGTVQLIALPDPEPGEPAEYLRADQLADRYPDAFAVRIDGESMTPEIAHGDVVLASPSAPAREGRAAIVQLRGQIGVTCKLFRRVGHDVHLVPINEQFPAIRVPYEQVEWAFRVIGHVRPAGRA